MLLPQDAAKQTGETALHIASYMGNAEVVRVLLHEGGADVNKESEVHSYQCNVCILHSPTLPFSYYICYIVLLCSQCTRQY